MPQKNKKASMGYKTPSEAFTLAFSDNPSSLLSPRKVRVKSDRFLNVANSRLNSVQDETRLRIGFKMRTIAK
jgi:hypothetical protein